MFYGTIVFRAASLQIKDALVLGNQLFYCEKYECSDQRQGSGQLANTEQLGSRWKFCLAVLKTRFNLTDSGSNLLAQKYYVVSELQCTAQQTNLEVYRQIFRPTALLKIQKPKPVMPFH